MTLTRGSDDHHDGNIFKHGIQQRDTYSSVDILVKALMFPHRVEFKIQSSSQECSYLNKLFSYDPSATNDLDGDNRVELSFSILSETIVGNPRILIDMKRKKKYLDACYLFLHLDLNL